MHSPWRFCAAPMMDWSDRHCRFFWRLLSRHTRLYSEMVTTGALLFGQRDKFLQFNHEEHPIALQLGGSDPAALTASARWAEDYGYDEINLNCGCPSDRVQNGKIGACLMAEPNLVGDCMAAMQAAVQIPVTVKHRIGIDDQDEEEDLHKFVECVTQAGCRVFIVHARKAWLKGLSPKENREVPPLLYDRVIRLKQAFPQNTIVLNGGLTTLPQCASLLEHLDGVMMGREAYHNPYVLADVDSKLFGDGSNDLTRAQVLNAFITYAQLQMHHGVPLHHLTRHILGLFAHQPGGKHFRRLLSQSGEALNQNALERLQEALAITESFQVSL